MSESSAGADDTADRPSGDQAPSHSGSTTDAQAADLAVPELSLVVLVGASGSGKSTFAANQFQSSEVLSSDGFRAMVADDENDQSATAPAFDALQYVAGKRLAAGRLTVIDATNVAGRDRQVLIELARAHDVLPIAIVLDLPESVCAERNAARADRPIPRRVVHRQREDLRRSLKRLHKEGFRRVHVLKTPEQAAASRVVREPLLTDKRTEHGPFDVIGDVHGCRSELESLLSKLGYTLHRDDVGNPVDAHHPEGRRAVFVGDLVDRGPDSPGVLRLVMGMVASGSGFAVPGNHENKLTRALRGSKVQHTHGLAETLEQLYQRPSEFVDKTREFLSGLVSHLVFDDGRLVVAHAGLKQEYHNRSSRRVREFALYGQTTGETDEFGLPVRYPWAEDYRGSAMVLYGHVPTPRPEWVNNTMCLDTGCAFGGRLTAMRYPECELVSVPAEQVWYAPAKPFPVKEAHAAAFEQYSARRRDPGILDVNDVLGKRGVETTHYGRVTISADSNAGALEVMSRYAVDPRWLVYLPPTMTPCATSSRADVLEYPTEAFSTYAADGCAEVICEEKHMGSRAVVVVCQNAGVAAERFGVADGTSGAVFTRTGRSFFSTELTEQLLDRVRSAISTAGLWDDLAADWLVLDTELLPWSAKAIALLREQYAAVGAAARVALPTAVDTLHRAAERGVDVTELVERTRRRVANADAFIAAYRRYCWPTSGLEGVQIAPFQVLASSAATYADRDHRWHLELADRMVGADTELFASTRRHLVRAGDADEVAAGTRWWEELTEAGGEGMVVKPVTNLTRARSGLAQPGVKVRGREYLRIIYGPDYTEPDHLARLRDRGQLRTKARRALREYALGLEGLDRFVAAEPLWRVHECVFGVLALESDPIDPRL